MEMVTGPDWVFEGDRVGVDVQVAALGVDAATEGEAIAEPAASASRRSGCRPG